MNSLLRITAPCHFGMEAVLKREIYNLGYDIETVDNGRVTFIGDSEALVRANISLRTAERILLNAGEFSAYSFTELFDKCADIEWEAYIPKNGAFPVVKATSVSSKLFSTRDIQSIIKKAVAERLKKAYSSGWMEESGSSYPIRVSIIKDKVTIGIDSSGESLHKRGYRISAGEAPISESLAAAIIMLTPWKKDRILVDPFCGSGTFLIEAAMIAADIQPGINREFTSQKWDNIINPSLWNEVKEEALSCVNKEIITDIQGYDIDDNVLKHARQAADAAGVSSFVHFQKRDVSLLSHAKPYGFIITNPPYGERLLTQQELPKIYRNLAESFEKLDKWSAYIITPYEGIEKDFGRGATKKRKLYNGMIKTNLYSFEGPKPPKKTKP